MRKVIIKASYFVDTDLFQHVSQWERAMMDFFAAHGAEMDRISVLGAGDGSLFYTVRKLAMIAPVSQPKPSDATKRMKEAKQSVNPALKKDPTPFAKIKEDSRPKRTFNPGSTQVGKVGKLSMGGQKPQGT